MRSRTNRGHRVSAQSQALTEVDLTEIAPNLYAVRAVVRAAKPSQVRLRLNLTAHYAAVLAVVARPVLVVAE